MPATTPTLPASLLDSVLTINDASKRIRWYMCVVITLSSLNYPDVIPQVYSHFEAHILAPLSLPEQFAAVQRVREGLIKSTGIVGAARTGNAMRSLSRCVPEIHRERESPRARESVEFARKRGHEFWLNVYARNPAFDPEASVRASPDYAFVVRDLLYAHVFSYDGVLDPLTTGYAIVSALYGLDCQNQLQNHMIGMLFNGAQREDLVELQELCLGIAKELGVTFRHAPAPIPTIPTSSGDDAGTQR